MGTFSLEEFKRRIAAITSSTVEPDEKMTLGELGIDSLNILEVIVLLEEVSGGALDPSGLELTEFTTLGDLYRLGIEALAPEQVAATAA